MAVFALPPCEHFFRNARGSKRVKLDLQDAAIVIIP